MKKLFNILTTLLLMGIIFYCGYQIYIQYNEYQIAENIYSNIEETYIISDEDSSNSENELSDFFIPEYEDNEFLNIDWISLAKLNQDIIGWIYCPDTQLNYPILKSKDNKDYLHKTVTGTINSSGSIFLDYRNDPELLDYVSVIYGHNMKNGSMFKTINRYKNIEWYKEHPTIQIYTEKKQNVYNIIGVIDAKSSDDIYDLSIRSKEDYMSFLDKWANKSIYDTGVPYDYNKRTILLSTCNGQVGGPKRIIVMLQQQENKNQKKISFLEDSNL